MLVRNSFHQCAAILKPCNVVYVCVQGGPQGLAPRYDMHRGPITQNSNANAILKIADITPYQNNWTIKGRCSVKSEMRRYNKNGRAGCVFNFDLLDDSGEIRCVCFGDVAEQYDQQIQQGKCYTLSKVTAKTMDANKRKWNQTGHNCEITVEKNSKVKSALIAL
jgi:replication factor A1